MKRKFLPPILTVLILLLSPTFALAAGYNAFDTSVTRRHDDTIYEVDIYSSNPHGGYANSTNKCKTCHAVHLAEGSYRITQADQATDACNYCHAGSSAHSESIVYFESANRDPKQTVNGHQIGTVLASQSDIPDREPTASWSLAGTFVCVSCHSVHANNIAPAYNNIYATKILKKDPDGDGTEIQSTSLYAATIVLFCTQCHNKNHGNSSTLTHPTYGYPDPEVPGSGPTCINCHRGFGTPHATKSVNMLTNKYDGTTNLLDAVCLECHQIEQGANYDCLQCHNPSPPAGYELAPDIESLNDKKSHHPVQCINCHLPDWSKHQNGTLEKYDSQDGNGYQMTYNLSVPRLEDPGGKSYVKEDFELCYHCHDESEIVGVEYGYGFDWRCYYAGPGGGPPPGYPLYRNLAATNFRSYKTTFWGYEDKHNWHWEHLNFVAKGPGAFPNSDSDLDGALDSLQTCTICHNPHGSDYPALTRQDLRMTYGLDDIGNFEDREWGPPLYQDPGGDVYCGACHGPPWAAKIYRNLIP